MQRVLLEKICLKDSYHLHIILNTFTWHFNQGKCKHSYNFLFIEFLKGTQQNIQTKYNLRAEEEKMSVGRLLVCLENPSD